MANEIETMASALSHFLRRQNIDPADVSLVLRVKDESTELRLVRSIDRALAGLMTEPRNAVSLRPGPADLMIGDISVKTEIAAEPPRRR